MAYRKPYPAKYQKAEIVKAPVKRLNSPSRYQEAVFNHIATIIDGTGNSLVVNAGPGSGKTTTLVEAAFRINDSGADISGLFLAFNKKIADELTSRLPDNFPASTMHSFGNKCIPGRKNINQYKVQNILCGILEFDWFTKENDRKTREMRNVIGIAKQIVGLCKADCVMPETATPARIMEIVEYYGIQDEGNLIGTHNIPQVCISALKANNADQYQIDFDDMIYFPAIFDMVPASIPDIIFVDEAQDLNMAQFQILLNLSKRKSSLRIVFVGDHNQAIYGFRGAGTDSMTRARQLFNADALPLTVCYRCGSAIVEHAKSVMPEIESFPGAPTGLVGEFDSTTAMDEFLDQNRDGFILCRRNAPLIRHAYRLIAKGIPAAIIGNDIGAALMAAVDRISDGDREMTVADFEPKMVNYFTKLHDKAIANKWLRKADEINDKMNAIAAFMESSKTVGEMLTKIKTLFVENALDSGAACVKLMSIHKSKGLETDTVIILNTPPVKCDKDWQQIQEKNMLLVARTRAKSALYYCDDESNKSVGENMLDDYE